MFGNLFEEKEDLSAVNQVVQEYAVENQSSKNNNLASASSVSLGVVLYASHEALASERGVVRLEELLTQLQQQGYRVALGLDSSLEREANSLVQAIEKQALSSQGSFFTHVSDPFLAVKVMSRQNKVPLLAAYSPHTSALFTSVLTAQEGGWPLVLIGSALEMAELAAPIKKVAKKKTNPLLVEEALSVVKSQLEQGKTPLMDATSIGLLAHYGVPSFVISLEQGALIQRLCQGEKVGGIELK